MKIPTVFLLILLVCQNNVFASLGTKSEFPNRQTKNQSFADDTLSLEIRRKTFDIVWETIRDKYYDSTFNGVNWNAVRTKYLPEAERLAGSNAFHAMLNRMLDEIKTSSHLSVAPPNTKIAPSLGVGLELGWIEKQIVVTQIEPNSPADKASIRVGERFVSVDGISVEEIYRHSSGKMTFDSAELLAQQRPFTVERKLRGAPETIVSLEIRGNQNKIRKIKLKRESKIAHGKLKPANFRKITPAIGYLQIPTYWWGKLDEQFDRAFRKFAECNSLIIDLRGNSGGQAPLITDLAARLMENGGSLGEFRYRDRKEQFAFSGKGREAFKGKVIVLIDERSASASEVFAASLKDLGRATVIGARSGGAVLLSELDNLPTGGTFNYATADYFTPKNSRIEGRGVVPDVRVKRTRRAIIEGRDTALEKELAVLSGGVAK